jgi:hypothetical protein
VNAVRLALAFLLVPTAAFADGPLGVLPWSDGTATPEDLRQVADAAAEVVRSVTGSEPVRLDSSAAMAVACRDAACLAGLGSVAGVSKLLEVTVLRAASASTPTVRLVLVETTDPPREWVRIETSEPSWPRMLDAALRPLVGGPPIVDPGVPSTGRLVVESNPPGASIFLDGLYQGTTPLPGLPAVAPGRHEVVFKLAGYADRRVDVSVAVGEETRALGRLHPVALPSPDVLERPTEREDEPHERWYGFQLVLCDLGTMGLAAATQSPVIWLTGYVLLPPIIHAANGNGFGTALSVVVRDVAPLGTVGIVYAFGGSDDDAAILAAATVLTGMVVDIAVLAWIRSTRRS